MTALGVALLVVGATLVILEAHVPTLGFLGAPGVVALGAGALLAVSGLGGGVVLGVVAAVCIVSIGAGALLLSLRSGLPVLRRTVRGGPEGLIGHIGVVRSWTDSNGKVLVDGALWHARRSLSSDDEPEEIHQGDPVVVERLSGLTLSVRRAEDWELTP